MVSNNLKNYLELKNAEFVVEEEIEKMQSELKNDTTGLEFEVLL